MEDPAIREDEILARREAARLAGDILGGSESLIWGAVRMNALLNRCRIQGNDADQQLFSIISSDTDHLPFGPVIAHWASSALDRVAPEMAEIESHYRADIIEACQRVIARFGDA
jgi:hypothetical protein